MKKSQSAFANQPFRELITIPKKKRRPPRPRYKPLPPKPSLPLEPLSDQDLFAQAMLDVEPLQEPSLAVAELAGAKTYRTEEEEVRRVLEDLVSGKIDFDMCHNDEHVEGSIQGLDPRILQKLRQGDLFWQAYLDLHGMRVEEAREKLEQFIAEQRRKHHRCLLIVHGRGLNSPDKEPILKRRLLRWLTRGFLRKRVLAFCSACPHDGGSGALYILMRK